MRRRLLILTTVLFLIAGAAYLYVASGRLHQRVRLALEAAAGRQFHRQVRIAALRGDPLQGLVLEGVALARGERLAEGTIVTAAEIIVRFRPVALLGDLLRRRGALRSIAEITLVRPEISLEISSAGHWNVFDLFVRPGEPSAAPAAFTPVVTLVDGRVTVTDFSGPPHPFRARLVEVNGRADLRRPPAVRLAFDLVSGHDGRRTPIAVRGKYLRDRATLYVDLAAAGAPLQQWGPYLVRTEGLVFEDGTADADVHLLSAPWGAHRALDFQGTVRLAGGAATLLPQRAHLRDVRGLLRVDNLRLQTDDLRLSVDGSPLRVRGEMTLQFGRLLDLAVTSPQLDLSTVQRLLFPGSGIRLEGTTGADIRVSGPWSALAVDGTISHARGVINRQPFSVESSGLTFIGDLLVFDNFTAAAEGARLRGDLRLTLGRGDILLAAEGENVLPEMLRRGGLPLQLPVRGRLNGSVALARTADALSAETTAAMGAGRAGIFQVDHLRAGGWYENGEITFPYLVAGRKATTVHASGTVSRRGRLDIDAAGTALDLRAVAREVGLTPRVQGTVDAEGRISGTLAQPVFDGTTASGPGRLESLEFDSAEGPLQLSRQSLTTPGVLLREGQGTYLVSGTVHWTHPSSLALTVEARDIPAASLARSAAIPLRLSGRVSGRLAVGGTTTRPAVSGRITLADGAVEGQRVDEAAATFRWQNGALTLEGARARVRDSVVTARGSMDRGGALRLTFAARGIDLRHLTVLPTEVVQAGGRVDLDGRIGGTTADPTVAATFASRDLVLNGQAFDRADGVVRWEDGRLMLEPVTLAQGAGTYTVRGSLGVNPLTFHLRGEVARGSLATLLALGRLRAPFALDGRLDGVVTVQGTVQRPAATLEARLTGGRLGDHPIEEAEARLSFRDDVVTVDRLTLRSGGGLLAAQGRLAPHGESQLEVGGADLNLDLLRPLLGVNRPLAGTLNFTTQISGRWQDPEIGLSLDIRRGGINGLRFDSLVANAFYKDGEFHVEQALLSEDGHRVKGVGVIPFNPARGVFAQQRPMSFEISLAEADLSLLALLLPQVQEAAGRLEGQVRLSGTPGRPEMTGRLAVRDGRVRLRGVATLLEEVRADIGFNQDRISLNTFAARLGSGTLAATGSIAIANFRPTQIERLTVRARDARLEVRPYFAGTVDADLTFGGLLTDPANLPDVTGQLTLKQGDLDALAFLPTPGRQLTYRGPDLRLRDVRLVGGENLVIHLGRLRVEINEGDALAAGGTLRQPSVTGRLTARRGTVTVFGRTFTLRDGEARFLPQLGMRPLISLDADADVLMEDGRTTKVFLEARQVFPDEMVERLVLRSDPPRSRDAIVALLAGQKDLTAPGADVQAILQAELGRALFGEVEETIARALGLSEFTIEYGFARPLQLRIGRLLVHDLYVRLTTIFEQPTRFVWSLEWRFIRNLMLTFSVDNAGRSDALLRYTIRF